MNKIKITALTILVLFLTSINTTAQASGIGFINYKKIQENYSLAKDSIKEVDAKALEIQQYLVDKEKEFFEVAMAVMQLTYKALNSDEYAVKKMKSIKTLLK